MPLFVDHQGEQVRTCSGCLEQHRGSYQIQTVELYNGPKREAKIYLCPPCVERLIGLLGTAALTRGQA